jgi:hypothetical protein
MPLRAVIAYDNLLTTLEPFVQSPPNGFQFDCPTLPETELERVRDAWAARPEHRRHARDAQVLLALRRHDKAALARLANGFRGRRYLVIPKALSWGKASAFCRDLGGHLATIHSREENDFVGQLAVDAFQYGAYIGLRRQGGRTTWETGEPVDFTNFFGDLWSARLDGAFGIVAGGYWRSADPNSGSCFIVEWDGDPAATAKRP